VIAMAEVTMSLEEYEALVRAGATRGHGVGQPTPDTRSKRKGTPNPKMARALKRANDWGRTKSGKLRKGVSQGDIMRKAHAYRRKM
jgi:hypothetical protein